MGRRKKLINNSDIPQHQIEAIARCILPDILAFYEQKLRAHKRPARCILPDILAFYESKEGQREFSEWKKQREMEKQAAKTE